jgi:hypothetical protein
MWRAARLAGRSLGKAQRQRQDGTSPPAGCSDRSFTVCLHPGRPERSGCSAAQQRRTDLLPPPLRPEKRRYAVSAVSRSPLAVRRCAADGSTLRPIHSRPQLGTVLIIRTTVLAWRCCSSAQRTACDSDECLLRRLRVEKGGQGKGCADGGCSARAHAADRTGFCRPC